MTAPTPIQPLPAAPNPLTDNQTQFNARALAFTQALSGFVTQANTQAAEVNAIRNDAVTQTMAIRSDAVTQTTAIRNDAVTQTTAIRDATEQIRLNAVSQTEAIRDQAIAARTGAEAAQTGAQTARSAAEAVANFRGAWSSLTGALNMPATVLHNGRFWVLLANLANVTLAEPGVASQWAAAAGGGIQSTAYDDRAILRTMVPAQGDARIVTDLGLFVWHSGSTEPDDDETCFATASGRWLLQLPSWDLATAMQLPEDEIALDRFDDAEGRITSAEGRWSGRILRGTIASSITSVNTLASVAITGTVVGAQVGNLVIATPPNNLDPRIAWLARVSAADTVTIVLNNPSASAASLATGNWAVAVIQEI